jgi:hypothetical protein
MLTRGYIESEDRRGHPAQFPLTTVIVGAALIDPGSTLRAEDVASAAADAKRLAKQARSGFYIGTSEAAPAIAGTMERVAA